MRLLLYYYVPITFLDWTLSCFAAPRPCPRLIQITCVIFTDDLWRRKIKKTNCVGGCQCGLWYCVLVKKHVKEKKKNLTSAPTLVLFRRCHSFKDWCLQTLQKCNAAPWQPASHSLNVNKSEIIRDPSLECQLINEIAIALQLHRHAKLFCSYASTTDHFFIIIIRCIALVVWERWRIKAYFISIYE